MPLCPTVNGKTASQTAPSCAISDTKCSRSSVSLALPDRHLRQMLSVHQSVNGTVLLVSTASVVTVLPHKVTIVSRVKSLSMLRCVPMPQSKRVNGNATLVTRIFLLMIWQASKPCRVLWQQQVSNALSAQLHYLPTRVGLLLGAANGCATRALCCLAACRAHPGPLQMHSHCQQMVHGSQHRIITVVW